MANGLFNLKQVVQAVQQGGWPAQKTPAVEYLVVAGGGSGGWDQGGGGGAGGLLTGIEPVPNGQTLLVTIGSGGAGVTSGRGNNGTDSVFGQISTVGGGGAGAYSSPPGTTNFGKDGGSGGGGGGSQGGRQSGGEGTFAQGNAGGRAGNNAGFDGGGAGGGGAGAVGATVANLTASPGGNGGQGIASAISGTVTAYAGGGGGNKAGGTPGQGGAGGGGAASSSTTVAGTAGTANTGGGGGGVWNTGGAYPSGAGGSGIVIVSYPDVYAAATAVGATASTSGAGSLFPNGAGTLQSQTTAPSQSGDFTLECWMNYSTTSSYRIFAGTGTGANYVGLYAGNIVINSSTSGTEKQIPLLAGAPTINTWFHYCIMRSGSTLYGFINGVFQGVVTFTDTLFAAGYLQVCGYTAAYQFPGYVSNLRLTNTLVYSTAGFTVPTSPLANVTGTALLMNTASGAPYLDSSSNATTFFTFSGTQPLWNQESPFATGAGYKNRVYKWTSSGSITF